MELVDLQHLVHQHETVYVLVDGPRGAGKTTAVRELSYALRRTVYGPFPAVHPDMLLPNVQPLLTRLAADMSGPQREEQVPIQYKTFDADPDKVPGLMGRGRLDIAQATIFALDAFDQTLGSAVVLMDRSPLSSWVCAAARARAHLAYTPESLRQHQSDARHARELMVEYRRLLKRLRGQVVHVLCTASVQSLRETHVARRDERPWAPVLYEAELFPGALASLPDNVHRMTLERP